MKFKRHSDTVDTGKLARYAGDDNAVHRGGDGLGNEGQRERYTQM